MRFRPALALAALLAGCVHTTHFRPVLAEQAVQGQPESATAETAGVRIWARAGEWSGWPDDLEERLTPVEAYVENRSGKALRIRPEHFSLLAPGGFRYQALEARDVPRWLGPAWRPRTTVYFYYGAYGAYPWPGFRHWGGPWYPYAWWGWWGGPYAYPPPAPPSPPRPGPEGTLESGGQVSVLLLFPVPAQSLSGLELDAELVEPGGQRLGSLRLSFARAAEGAPPPPPAATPAPMRPPLPPAPEKPGPAAPPPATSPPSRPPAASEVT
jgi:hypothetical protein